MEDYMEQEDGFILSTNNKRPAVYMDQPPAGSSGFHPPQKQLCISSVGSYPREISENPGTQDGSQSYVSQDWQGSGSNFNHVSNWNGGLTDGDYPNSGFDLFTNDATIIQNSHLIGSGQLSQGAAHTSTLTTMRNYQSSSSGNVRVEVNNHCLPSSRPQPVEILDNNPTLNLVNTSVALNQHTVDVGDVGDAGSIELKFCIRLHKLLCLGLSTSPSNLHKTLKLCAEVSELLEDDSKCEALVNFTKLVETPAHIVKDQCIRKELRNKFRIWLFDKIAEGGTSANKLDEGGQGVLHMLAALGYDRAIESILKAAILNIDLLDVNKDTALDWASRMGRNDTVKLLESHGATPRSARKPFPTYPSALNAIRGVSVPTYPCVVIPDFKQIQQMAKSQWLTPSLICEILCNHQQHPFEHRTPPTNGSLFLFDTNIHPNFRDDGLTWKKENHNSSKAKEFITTYAHGTENNHLTRRWYRLKKELSSSIVLVHYREVQASNSNSKHGSYSVGGPNAGDNPDSGPEHHHYLPFGQHSVNQTTRPNGVNQMDLSNAGGMQNSYLIGPDELLLQDALKLSHSTSTERSESSCNDNLSVEDNDNYSSSKQVLLEGRMPDDIVTIDNLDCCTSDQLEDVIEKTIQPCLDAQKGAVGSEDRDEQCMANILIFPGANTGLVTDPTPKCERTPEDLASSSGYIDISSYLAESITLQESSRTDRGMVAVTVSEQTAIPVGVDFEFGLSDDHAPSFLPLMTKNAAKDSELVHAAAVRIQNKFRSWKGRVDFLLTRQQIIKIQAHVRGHQVRVKKAFPRGESMVEYPEAPYKYHDFMNVALGVPQKEELGVGSCGKISTLYCAMGRSPCGERAWTMEEDDRLITYIRAHGAGEWRLVPKAAGLRRCGKSCRLRWMNYLRPDLKYRKFTEEEDELIITFHSLLGNKWSLIAGRLTGRTDNEIKNYWNTHIRKKLLSRGIDPATHRPINQPPSPRPSSPSQLETITNISFSAGKPINIKEQEKGSSSLVSTATGSGTGEQGRRCPDLNLDLRISLPCPSQPQPQIHQDKTLIIKD